MPFIKHDTGRNSPVAELISTLLRSFDCFLYLTRDTNRQQCLIPPELNVLPPVVDCGIPRQVRKINFASVVSPPPYTSRRLLFGHNETFMLNGELIHLRVPPVSRMQLDYYVCNNAQMHMQPCCHMQSLTPPLISDSLLLYGGKIWVGQKLLSQFLP